MSNEKQNEKDMVFTLKNKLLNKILIQIIKNDEWSEKTSAKIPEDNILKVTYKYYGEDNYDKLLLSSIGYSYNDMDSKYNKSEEAMLFMASFEQRKFLQSTSFTVL